MRNSKFLRLLALMAAALLFLAACGGDSDESADTDSSDDSTATTDSPDTASDSEDGSDAADEPDDSASDDAGDAGDSGEEMSGSSNSSWCEGAREIERLSDEIDAENLGMIGTFERQFRELLPMQLDLVDVAPDEISDDVEILAEGLIQVRDILEEVDYNILDLSDDQMAVLESPEFEAASDRVDEYNETVCGIGDDDDMDSEPSLGINEADVDAMLNSERRDELLSPMIELGLTEEQAECVMRTVLVSGMATTPGNAEFIDALEDCGLTLEDLARIGLASEEAVDPDAIEGMDTLMAALPIFAGNPDMVPMIVEGLVDGGIPEEAAQCLGDALAAPDAAEQLTDVTAVAAVLDECGVSVDDLLSFAG